MLQILVTDVSTNYGKLLVCFGRILLTVLATRTMSIFSHGNSQNEPFKWASKTDDHYKDAYDPYYDSEVKTHDLY